jgi:NADPH-dependent 2,4-dienoyl-CoA reductase/sulfur reductase-like enzyme
MQGAIDDEDDETRADASGRIHLPTLTTDAPLPERAEIAIVGGGVMGLAIAYHLAKRGLTDVVGSSGRRR